MKFRPCIDIHNGKVRQIVGSSLRDEGDSAKVNFTAEGSAADFAALYRSRGLDGGHIILLNPSGSEYYEQTRAQAEAALAAWPGGMQIGGGVTADNAADWLDAGASAVIVTSYVFREGRVDMDRLAALESAVGPEHIVLDLSCRREAGTADAASTDAAFSADPAAPADADAGHPSYRIVTDRWQKPSETFVSLQALEALAPHCREFLIHAVDAEGKQEGPEKALLELLSNWNGCPVTYAGGIRSTEDIQKICDIGRGRIDFTVGSALDLFGGTLPFETMCLMSSGSSS